VHGNNHKPDWPDRVLVSCKAARAIRSSVSITCRYPATANKLGPRNRADASLHGRAATGVTVKLRRVLSRTARSYRPSKYAKCPLLTRKLQQISLAPAERERAIVTINGGERRVAIRGNDKDRLDYDLRRICSRADSRFASRIRKIPQNLSRRNFGEPSYARYLHRNPSEMH